MMNLSHNIPVDVIDAPMRRTFTVSNATIRTLSKFGAQVPVFIGNYFKSWEPYRPYWNYEDGIVWKGALDLYQTTGDEAFLDYILKEMETRVLPDGSMPTFLPTEYNIDHINGGKILFPLYEIIGEDRFRKAMDIQFAQLKDHPRTKSGNYWHKQIYPHQVWLDGMFMAQPFQVAYARITGNEALFADSVQQFSNVDRLLKKDNGLYFHGWDESRQERWSNPDTGLSPNVWGRAMGWWIGALVESYEHSTGLDEAGRAEIARITRDTLSALLKFRSANGLWYQVVDQGDRDGNYEEASASLMISYGLMKAARLGIVGDAERIAGPDSLQAAIDRFLTPTALNGICGVAGLGNVPYRDGTFAYYMSEKITPNDPKGVGALMWSLSEGLNEGKA
ncbi:glycoside hydrolase family 88/105 protein [Asticcacaulis endophyticus]|uniref:Glycoside hydrolase 105 family protein n=1 Tax=Asticcacaulis endophyticus TaxID=1395890 RepID=A0A918UNF5_9CAUL|nr:glycoside hydrolase family 88 protein [Asticcacaulis endophyticus]GGZ22324.1 glycoside hydrolase 105 family protein [Asticcacaulis endophyticus]